MTFAQLKSPRNGSPAEPLHSSVDVSAAMSVDEFSAVADTLHKASGISLPLTKKGLVVSRLAKRLRLLGLPDFTAYLLRVQNDSDELMQMVSCLTTNVTGFFREAHHFDYLAQSVLPPLLASARSGGRVRLWSSACSTGEEPFSLAMTVLSLCPDAGKYDIRILATDIDPAALHVGQEGRYSAKACEVLGPDRRQKYLQPDGENSFVVQAHVRKLVTFNNLNLNGIWPMAGKFDVIFCRNVVIYFDAATRTTLWHRFAEQLTSGGHLFIGHSERLDASSEKFFETAAMTTYRRR